MKLFAAFIFAVIGVALCDAAWAKNAFASCDSVAGRSTRPVPIPPELVKLLIADDKPDTASPDAVSSNNYIATAFDLNGDGNNELLIITNPNGLNAVAKNNPVWVVEHSPHGYRELLYSFAGMSPHDLIVTRHKTHHYYDICIIQQGGAADHSEAVFRFNGNTHEYEESACRHITIDPYNGNRTVDSCD